MELKIKTRPEQNAVRLVETGIFCWSKFYICFSNCKKREENTNYCLFLNTIVLLQ